eukprot:3228283-Prymnesium_polylepis.1
MELPGRDRRDVELQRRSRHPRRVDVDRQHVRPCHPPKQERSPPSSPCAVHTPTQLPLMVRTQVGRRERGDRSDDPSARLRWQRLDDVGDLRDEQGAAARS